MNDFPWAALFAGLGVGSLIAIGGYALGRRDERDFVRGRRPAWWL